MGTRRAKLYVQWTDPDYPGIGNLDLHEVDALGERVRLIWHETFWVEDPDSYHSAFQRMQTWINHSVYEVIDVVSHFNDSLL